MTLPPIDDLDADELRVLYVCVVDDLRRLAAVVDQVDADTPHIAALHKDAVTVLESWTSDPNTYSDGTVVAQEMYDAERIIGSHVHAPPHRRGYATTEGN